MNKPVHDSEAPWNPNDLGKNHVIKMPTTQTGGTPAKPLRPLTRKQAAFVRYLVEHPKHSATAAARATYNVTTDNSASLVASENIRKPQVVAELSKYSGTAELTLIQVMDKSTKMMHGETSRAVDWAVNARQTADSILDRLHGKAKQTVESSSTVVTLTIDLTGVSDTDKD